MQPSRIGDNRFKTKPMWHQMECLRRYGRHKAFALLAEMGVGKSKIVIDNTAELWGSGDLNGVLIFAPNGVHYNWILREIPKHMPDWVRYVSAAWVANPNKEDQKQIDALFDEHDSSVLRIFTMNVESLQHKRSIEVAHRFATSCTKLMIVVDESSAFKNPKAQRTKELMKLKKHSEWRRIMNGTPVSNGPFDAYAQFNFLDESILDTGSYYAFKAEYAEILQHDHPLVQHIVDRNTGMKQAERDQIEGLMLQLAAALKKNGRQELTDISTETFSEFEVANYREVIELHDKLAKSFDPDSKSRGKLLCLQLMAQINQLISNYLNGLQRLAAVPGRVPQIVDRDKNGAPKYRNLDKLTALIAPYSFRVLKKDCLDLPDKIYKYVWFDMTAEQRRIYDKAEKENRLALNGEETTFNKLVAQMKLMQITSGYFLHPDQEEPVRIDGPNPKLDLLVERAQAIVESGEKLIIWARFHVQIEDVARALRAVGLKVVEYHGKINKAARNDSIEQFERGDAQVFVSQQQAGGRGLTLVAASHVFYFSNTYALDDREQSEDRSHRIGQEKEVIYTDFCARNSIDYECIERLHSKEKVAEQILNPIS